MTQGSRTTESSTTNYDGIRDIMHQIRDRLTVPDRSKLAVGIVGHLATLMNRHQMQKLLDQLREEAERVQDVPPSRRRDFDAGLDTGTDTGAEDAGGGAVGEPGRHDPA